MNQLHLAKNGLQYVSNRGIWSTSVTNGAFLLAFVTTPIDSAHSMHYARTAAGLVLSAHAHNIEYYGLVKVVNNASGTRLAGSYSQTGIQSPTGVPLVNLLCKIITWLIFLDIPTWFENATAWSRAPKMVLSKHAYHISPTEI